MQRFAWTSFIGVCLCGTATPAIGQSDPVPAPRSAPPVYATAPADMPDGTTITTEVGTLADAVRLVYQNNPSLLSQRATVRSVDNRYPIARANYGLTLDAEVTHGYQRNRFETLLGWTGAQGWSTVATAILTQPLFTFGRNAGAEQSALTQIAFARDTLRLNQTQILLSTISAYISVIRDREAVLIARENLALLDKQLTESQARYEVRDITDSDLKQIETRVELGRAQLLLAEGQVSDSEANFVQFVGARPAAVLAPPTELIVPLTSLDQAYDIGDNCSPVIRAAQSREKVSRAAITALRASFGPRIDLRGRASYGTVTPYSNDMRSTELRGEVALRMPLLDANLRLSRLREAEEANAADWRLIDQSVRETHATIASSWKRLETTRASLANYDRAVAAARRAYDGAVEQEIAGTRTMLDVLDLARDLLTVRNGYVSARANETFLRATMLAALGDLDAEAIAPGLSAYDPAEHFDKVRGRADLPIVTGILSGLDGVTAPNVTKDRPVTDPGATVRLK